MNPEQAGPPREALHGITLGQIGRSGLRSLLSSSGNLGDLQNRAGSYRLAVQMEFARTAPLEGRLAGLDQALDNPDLPETQRERLIQDRSATLEELESVPTYRARYRTATAQSDALLPFGFLNDNPLFLFVKLRGHIRHDRSDGLTVFTEGLTVGPVLAAPGKKWILSPRLTVGRTDVDIRPFDGHSGSTSVGPSLSAGKIFGNGWSVALQSAVVWSRWKTDIVRGTRDGSVEVTSSGWSRSLSVKGEVKGSYALSKAREAPLTLNPRGGIFYVSSFRPAVTNSLGETGTGPFGAREHMAAAQLGAGLRKGIGSFTPGLRLAWERELTSELSVRIDDPWAVRGGASVSWTWARGRRILVDYSIGSGLDGLRDVSDLTVVLLLDG